MRKLNQDAPLGVVPSTNWKNPRDLGPHKWALEEFERLRSAREGDGINKHYLLLTCARGFAPFYPPSEIFDRLSGAVANCGRHVPAREIWNAIEKGRATSHQPPLAASSDWTPPPAQPATPSLPKEDAELVASILSNGKTTEDLKADGGLSVDSDSWEPNPDAFIDALFPDGDPLLCIGSDPKGFFRTKRRSEWRGKMADMAFITPSPMSSLEGQTQAGHSSQRSNDNTGPRQYYVMERDHGTQDEQAALAWHLIHVEKLPVVLVVFSGGKSLHVWLHVDGMSETVMSALFQYAARLGYDPSTRARSQMVRLPDGVRINGDDKTYQTALWFDGAKLAELQKGVMR